MILYIKEIANSKELNKLLWARFGKLSRELILSVEKEEKQAGLNPVYLAVRMATKLEELSRRN